MLAAVHTTPSLVYFALIIISNLLHYSPRESPVMDEKIARPLDVVIDGHEKVLASTTPESPLERWNGTRTNAFRFCVTLLSFTIMGMNDAAIGVCL